MKKKLLLTLLALVVSSLAISQTKQYLFVGKVLDSLGPVKNVNIIDLKTNQGTFTNERGEFKFYGSVGDSIRISSILHTTEFKIISEKDLKEKHIDVYLERTNIILDEFDLKTNNLDGILSLDAKKTPKDVKAEALRKNMDFSKINFKEKVEDDFIDKKVRPPINNTDPTRNFVGAGASAYIAFKHSEKLWRTRRKVAFKQAFPEKLKTELGEKFFFQDLGIPEQLYYHFLEYCSSKGIEDMYLKNRVLDLVKVLKTESSGYLKLLDSELKNLKKENNK